MQKIAFDEQIAHQDYEFYGLIIKRSNWLYFKFFIVWSMWIHMGRVHLRSLFAIEFGIILDSNLISRIMKDLGLNLAPKRRVRELCLTFEKNLTTVSSSELLLQPVADENLEEFKLIGEQSKKALLHTITDVASGDTLSEIQNANPDFKPFTKLKQLGSLIKKWKVHSTDKYDATGIAIDEKVIKKAFDINKHRKLSSHWVSRVKTYLPSLIVEVVGLVRPGRMAELVGHFFPYPQKEYDHTNKRKSMKKHVYLIEFLEDVFKKFGNLVLLADANYSTKALISWLMDKGWHFVMRLNTSNKIVLKPLQEQFDADEKLKHTDKWIYSEERGGFIRILAYRRRWVDAKGKEKEKRYFLITSVDWPVKDVWKFYRLRWTLENTFKCLPILDKTPGLDPDLISGFFALVFHVIAPMCYQSRSSSRTLAKLLDLPIEMKKNRVVWQNVSTHFARRLLLIAYQRSMELSEILLLN